MSAIASPLAQLQDVSAAPDAVVRALSQLNLYATPSLFLSLPAPAWTEQLSVIIETLLLCSAELKPPVSDESGRSLGLLLARALPHLCQRVRDAFKLAVRRIGRPVPLVVPAFVFILRYVPLAFLPAYLPELRVLDFFAPADPAALRAVPSFRGCGPEWHRQLFEILIAEFARAPADAVARAVAAVVAFAPSAFLPRVLATRSAAL
jgi:hypothetical protein